MVEDYFFGPNGLANQNMEANENDPTGSSKKRVIVFHCEFSSERAPAMLRFLRKMDRAKNRYPALDFPELYLLKDGYKVIILTFHPKISSFWLILIHFWARNELVWSFRNALRVRLLFLARNWLISIEPMSLFCDFFVWSPKLGYFENFLFELKIRLLTAPFISTRNRLISQFSSFQPKLIIFGQNLIFIFRHSFTENRPSIQQRAHTFQCLIRDTLKSWDDFVKNAKHYHHQKSNNRG